MSRTANPVAVGGFVVGTILLAVVITIFVSGGNWFAKREHFVLVYSTSIKGLNVGAPVTIKGVKIGEVVAIKARMASDTLDVFNTVEVEIDPGSLERNGGATGSQLLDELIKRGLRAQLHVQSLLTGLLYIDVDFHPDKPPHYEDIKTAYQQIPTIPTGLEQLTRDFEDINIGKLSENLQQIVSGVNSLVNDKKLQNLGKDVAETLAAVRDLANQLNKQSATLGERAGPLIANSDQAVQEFNRSLPLLTQSLQNTMTTLQQTADKLQTTAVNTTYLTSEDSPLLYRIDSAASGIDAAAQQVQNLTEQLEQQLYGKRTEK